MSKPTVITKEGLKVWVEFDYDWDDDIAMAMATSATVEGPDGQTWELNKAELRQLVDVDAIEEQEAEGMSLTEYYANAGDYYEDR